MATSGTVSQTVFRTQKVLDHAFRRCRLTPQQITGELIQTALDLLYLRLSADANTTIFLWAVRRILLPMYTGVQSVSCPVGVSDVFNVSLRNVTRITNDENSLVSASEGVAANAFDSDVDTVCTQVLPDGWIAAQLPSAARATTFGILPNATGTWSVVVEGSNDGATYTPLYTNAEYAAVDGEWLWVDVFGTTLYQYYRLRAADGTVLDVREFFVGNNPNEIVLGMLNRDDYFNMPDKTFLGRPTSYWLDKQREQQVLQLWPAPGNEFTFYQLVAQVQYYIQDIGTMREELEIPQRWFAYVVAQLAADVAQECKEVDASLVPGLVALAQVEEQRAKTGESDRARTMLSPNISRYTRR